MNGENEADGKNGRGVEIEKSEGMEGDFENAKVLLRIFGLLESLNKKIVDREKIDSGW